MSYQVLARKWRPASFEELVGQEHVVRALVNALNTDRIHHAYLFTGTRGVGKTTIARILSRCLNCEQGVSAAPCGECSACQEILQGRFVDLIEVDAASRTKVEDTRELLENVQYTPTSGRYKVYLIDEVHMLSKHSFNALLKTLEEPPPHVKFLLATTDPQKLPVTVLSRCLQFNLKRVPADLISGHMEKIVKAENIKAESPALVRLAQAADGSIRDGLSLLDQAISFGDGELSDADVGRMLGSISRDHLLKLLQGVSQSDAAAVMTAIDELAEMSPDYSVVLDDLISLLHNFAVLNAIPEIQDERLGELTPELIALAKDFNAQDLQLFYEIAVRARRDLPVIPNRRYGLEMAMLRMLAFGIQSGDAVVEQPKKARRVVNDAVPAPAKKPAPAATAEKVIHETPAPVATPEVQTQAVEVAPATRADNVQPEPEPTPNAVKEDPVQTSATPQPEPEPEQLMGEINMNNWAEVIPRLKLVGMSQALASHSTIASLEDNKLTLAMAASDSTYLTETSQKNLTQSLSAYLQKEIMLIFTTIEEVPDSPAEKAKRAKLAREHQADSSIHSDPVIESLTSTFNATIIPGSITPDGETEGDSQ